MSQNHTGNVQPEIDKEEHDHLPGKVAVKKVGTYGWNGSDWTRLSTESDGSLNVNATLGDLSIDTVPYGIAYGPLEDTGYLYIGYQADDGAWYMKRQAVATGAWEYVKGASGLDAAWADKASQSWGSYDSVNGITTASGVLGSDVTSNNEHIATATKQTDGTQVAQMLGKTGDATFQVPRLDSSTHTLQAIEYEHHEIHAGSAFSYHFSGDVAGSGTNHDLLITTPDTTKEVHLRLATYTEAEFTIYLYEGPTTSGGSAKTPVNRNRIIASAATVSLAEAPTVTGVGTQLRVSKTGSGTGSGGGSDALHEWVLARNTKYLLRFTKATTGTHYIGYRLFFYEHTNKEA